jgi:hypothetical protein
MSTVRRRRPSRLILAAATALLLPATLTLAQQQVTTPGPQAGNTGPAPETWHASINPYTSHSFDADFHGTNGTSVAVTRAGVDANGRIPLSHELHFDLGLSGEYSNYHFEHATAYLGSNTVNLDLYDVQLAPGLSYDLSDQWSVFGGASLESAGEAGTDLDEDTMYGGYVGLKHKLSDHFSYTFALGGRTQLEDDPEFFPLLGLDWDINDSLHLALSTSARGADLRLSQSLVHDLAISLVAGYESRQYRLDDVPTPDSVLLDTRIPLTVELAWRPNPAFALRASAGYVVWEQLEFDDSHGYELSKKHPDPTPFCGLSAILQF